MPTFHVTAHSGFVKEAVDALKLTLSQCWRVQEWLGLLAAGDPQAAALAAIVSFTDDPPASGEQYTAAERLARLPRVFITLSREAQQLAIFRRTVDSYVSNGTLSVILERPMTTGEAADDNLLCSTLVIIVGDLIEEMRQSAGTGATLDWTAIDSIDFGRPEPEEEVGVGPDIAVISFDVRWGASR